MEDLSYSRSNSLISTRSQNPEVNSHVLPPLAFQRVRRCLLRIPLEEGQEIKEEAIERLTKHVVMETYDPGKDVILKGDSTKGIFVIIEGSLSVRSEDGGEVFSNLSEGDFFGEISLIFDIPCTARVQTDTSCILAHLEPHSARRLFHKVSVDIIDWFVTRRYLPTSSDIDVDRCFRRMSYTYLKACPVFKKWGEDSLKTLILDLDPAMVVLYQPHTSVICINDPPIALDIIIRGRAVVQDDQSKTLVTIDVGNQGDDPVVIGEEGMYLEHHNRISITTTTCCEIIHIKEEWIQNTLDKYPQDAGSFWKQRKTKWRALLNKKEEIYQQYPSLLQFEVIYQLLKNSSVLSKCSTDCVQNLALYGIPEQYEVNDYVCIQEEIEDGSLVLVLVGELELVTDPDTRYAYTVNEGEIFCPNEWMKPRVKLVAKSESLAFKIDSSVVKEALKKNPSCELVYPVQPL
ncbi:uncharacterized protein LOC133186123 [Saccostrea echinata]|uniref:uncharacterized protein LOC133186123 n=1 Tax=Saccostrea echinata TaxID=191078 RepID=UPI002A80ED9D|nr:uncharacterized protein LOC133186123 [Saccostrea echinata]